MPMHAVTSWRCARSTNSAATAASGSSRPPCDDPSVRQSILMSRPTRSVCGSLNDGQIDLLFTNGYCIGRRDLPDEVVASISPSRSLARRENGFAEVDRRSERRHGQMPGPAAMRRVILPLTSVALFATLLVVKKTLQSKERRLEPDNLGRHPADRVWRRRVLLWRPLCRRRSWHHSADHLDRVATPRMTRAPIRQPPLTACSRDRWRSRWPNAQNC